MLTDQQGGPLSLRGRPYNFRARTSLMAAFSSARSAYIRFSLAFSASSSRNRVTSETLAPPYLLRRWKKEARLPSPGAGGECVLSVQIDYRGSAARPVPRRASGRVRGRVSRPEPDDRARSARVVQYWSVTCRWVGIVDGQFRVMHQRRACGELDSDGLSTE